MKTIKWIAAVVVILALALVGAGFLVEPKWQVREQVTVQAPAAQIFPYLNTPGRWPAWTVWNTETYPELEFRHEGPEAGVGAIQRWRDGGSNGVLRIIESVENHLVTYRLVMDDGKSLMYGELRLATNGPASTDVSWKAWGDSGGNPVTRLRSLIYRPTIAEDFRRGLSRLKARVEGGAGETGSG